jgi:hypothetical protein
MKGSKKKWETFWQNLNKSLEFFHVILYDTLSKWPTFCFANVIVLFLPQVCGMTVC